MRVAQKTGLFALLVALPIGLLWAGRTAASWRPVRSVQAAHEFESMYAPEAQCGDWDVFKEETRTNSTSLRLVNRKTKAHFERTIVSHVDQFDLGAVAVSTTGDCFYSLSYPTTSNSSGARLAYFWCRGSLSPRLMKGVFFEDAMFSDDGKSLYALPDTRDCVEIFDVPTAKRRDKLALPPIRALENTRYFQVVPDRGVEVWQLVAKDNTTVLSRLNLQTRRTQVVKLRNCQGVELLSSGDEHCLLNVTDELKMFDASTGALLWRRPRANDLGVKLSPDGTMCVVALDDQFRIYDTRTGRLLRGLPAAIVSAGSGLEDFDFSSDSNRLITSYMPNYTAPPTVYFSQRAR